MIEHHKKNPFGNPTISEEKYEKLVESHFQRLNANNDTGTYTDLINEGSPKFTLWKQTISVEAIELALRQGRTISMNDSVKLIKSYISKKRGVIMDKFAEGTTQYEQFYPYGAMEYSEANLGKLRTITERWIAAATTFAADLPANLASDGQLFLDAFITNRASQLLSAGEVVQKDSDSDIARADMNNWMYKCLLTLLLIHIADVERVNDFYDLSITKKKAKTTWNVEVNSNEVKNILKGFAETQVFEIENTGDVPLLVYTADAANTPYQGWGISIDAHAKLKFTVAQLGGFKVFLNTYNQNGTVGKLTVNLVSGE